MGKPLTLHKDQNFMDIQTKYLIIEKLMQTQDEQILNQVKELLGITDKDWWDEISQAEKEAIQKGIDQLDKGEGIPHEEVMKRVNEKFFKKK
jgi:thiamine pyrophosphate-dependent acetolactate synthase large subunit-like protein